MKEQNDVKWIPLYDYDDYLICAHGAIKSKDLEGINSLGRRYKFSSRALKSRANKINPLKFIEVTYMDGEHKKKKTIYLHRAVADHFLPTLLDDQLYIIHKNGGHADNRVENLVWATKEELATIHYTKRKESNRRTWITRRKLYGANGLKENKDDKGSD